MEFKCGDMTHLEKYGYKMEDGEEYREIIEIATGEIIKYDWGEVIQLV